MKFFIELTGKAKKFFIPIIILGTIIFVMLFLPWNWWGTPREDYEGLLNIRLLSTACLVLYSYFVYILIGRTSLKVARSTEDPKARLGFMFLFYATISMMLFFLMFIGDTMMISLFSHPGYSEFVYVAWIFAILFYIFCYISLIMPKWILKRIEK